MKGEDQPVGMAVVVVVRKPQREVPRLTAARNGHPAALAGAEVRPARGGTGILVRNRPEGQRRGLAATGTPNSGATKHGSARATYTGAHAAGTHAAAARRLAAEALSSGTPTGAGHCRTRAARSGRS